MTFRTRNRANVNPALANAPARRWRRSSLSGPVSILITVAALVYAFYLLRALPARANKLDFSHYYVSALMMRLGINPYATDIKPLASSLGLKVNAITLATYPPTFLLLFEPLTLLSPLPAFWLWSGMGMVFLAMSLCLLLDGLPEHHGLRLSLVGLVILYPPITNNFVWGQTQLMLLFLFTLFMRWLASGRHALAGSIVGLAGLLKVFPLLLVGYLLARRQWKAIFYAGLVLVAGGLLTLALIGVDRSLDFLTVLPSITSQRWLGRPTNVALGAMISHIFWYSAATRMDSLAGIGTHLRPGLELARRVTVLLAQLTVLVLTVYATFRSSSASSRLSDNRDEPVIALWVVSAVLLTPTAWIHYLVLLLIPYAVLLRQHLRGEASPRATWLGLASFVVGELLMAVDLVPTTLPAASERMLRDFGFWATLIGWPVSLLLAYAAIYSLAVEDKTPPGCGHR